MPLPITLTKVGSGDLGYFKVLSTPEAIVEYDGEVRESGDYFFNRGGKARLGYIKSTKGSDVSLSFYRVMILAAPKLLIVSSVPRKEWTKSGDLYYSEKLDDYSNFKREGLYLYNPNKIDVSIVVNDLYQKIAEEYREVNYIKVKGGKEYQVEANQEFDLANDQIPPEDWIRLFSWSRGGDISILSPGLDYLGDYELNMQEMVLEFHLRVSFFKYLDIDPEYYGLHKSELINQESNKIYRKLEPDDTSELLVIGSSATKLDLRQYLPLREENER